MIYKIKKCLTFENLINIIAKTSYDIYHIIVVFLVLVASICNFSSEYTLPMFWILVAGFVSIIYLNIYSIKQTYIFCSSMDGKMSGDSVFLIARTELKERIYTNKNWLTTLVIPAFIVPVVVYVIKCPLGLFIKIFAYSALYIILALCFIGYTQYVALILMTRKCSKEARQITRYDKIRPHKTEWIIELASLTNKQSNLFFLVGLGFILLLYLITLTGFYNVQLNTNISKILVIYLWGIIAIAIVIMFPVFSVFSYLSIKNLITQLVEKEISECNYIQKITEDKKNRSKKKQKHLELLQAFNQLKILMLEKTPVYPQKPLVAYAASYVIAIINFAATVQAALSLVKSIH